MTTVKKYAKPFLIFFLVTLLIASVAGTFLRRSAQKVEEEPVFGPTETRLVDELDTLVPSDSPLYETFTESERVNILCLGLNTGMTDVIMVCSYDIKQQVVDLISVPRDTYVYRDGVKSAALFKINSIYHTSGKNSKGENKDVVAVAKAVSEILQGMPIHYYAVISYDSVRNIVNAMGGVPMDVPMDMDYEDPDDTPPLQIHIKKGYQVLDGDTAVKFLRFRSGYKTGDIGRIEAQQQFMKAAFKQLLKSDLLKMARVVTDNVESDITWGLVAKIVSSITHLEAENISTYTIPHTLENKSPWYVYPDPEGITDMIKEIYAVPVGEEPSEEGAETAEEQ